MNSDPTPVLHWDDDPIAYIRNYHPSLTEDDAERIRRKVIEYDYNCAPEFKYGINHTSVNYVVTKYLHGCNFKEISDE